MAQYICAITPEHSTLVLDIGKMYNIPAGASVTIRFPNQNTYSTTKELEFIKNHVFINSVIGNNSTSDIKQMTSSVYPYIFTIRASVDDESFVEMSVELTVLSNGSSVGTIKLYFSMSDVQEIQDVSFDAKQLNTKLESFMLLRTNPKLSGNIKLVVDSHYRLYLDTFKVSNRLNNRIYRKYPISSDGNYPRDVMTVFGNLPKSELFKLPSDSLNTHKFYSEFDNQYITEYEYGAETNMDNLYPENLKILAPLHIGKNIPDFFCIFRYDGTYNDETYRITDINNTQKFVDLLKTSSVVKIFDLRTYTSIGQYLNNYKDIVNDFLYGSCYMQFIEQDNEKYDENYRQGNNSWKGVDVAKGLLTNKVETTYFATNVLNSSTGVQEAFNNYIINGYERNNVLYPYIINLEFMFDDREGVEDFTMHRYFGLYLSQNEFLNYKCIVSDGAFGSEVRLDENDNLIDNDDILKNIFDDKFSDKIFCMTTNNDVMRVQSNDDVEKFIRKYVYNNPDKNLCNIKSDFLTYNDGDQSFITMNFTKPIHYGEHFRFVALNYTNGSEVQNICIELIASNDKRLVRCDEYISPYVSTNQPMTNTTSETDSLFYRVSFYTQDVSDEYSAASLPEQFKRMEDALDKVGAYVRVASRNESNISFISTHSDVYFQHISAINDYDEPPYGVIFMAMDGSQRRLYYTDSVDEQDRENMYVKDICERLKENGVSFNEVPLRVKDIEFDSHQTTNYIRAELTSDDILYLSNIDTQNAVLYTDYNSDSNRVEDTIRYFSKNVKSYMKPMSPDSVHFLEKYAVFSMFGFESLGWRYQNIVKFKNMSELKNPVVVYDDIDLILKTEKHPLVKSVHGTYEVISKTVFESGYITDDVMCELMSIVLKDDSSNKDYITQSVVLNDSKFNTFISPYNVNAVAVDFVDRPYMHNSMLSLYSPESTSLCVMGIYSIKDLDVSVNSSETKTVESTDTLIIPAGTKVKVDSQSDGRIRRGVLYRIDSGSFIELSMYKFCIFGDDIYYSQSGSGNVAHSVFSSGVLTATSDVYLTSIDNNVTQEYSFEDESPVQSIENFYRQKSSSTDNLYIPIVPLTNCNWDSNGNYFDWNNSLNVGNMSGNYSVKGFFTEHQQSPLIDSVDNAFIRNTFGSYGKIGSYVGSFKNIIFNKKTKNPIRKLLIQNNIISTSVGYYNSYVQSLEFIHYGIKFNMKFNSEYYTQVLNMSKYNNFEIFIINDYNPIIENEIIISSEEEIILIVNHKYDVNNHGSVYSRVKDISGSDVESCGYGVYNAPYSVVPDSISGNSESMICYKTTTDVVERESENVSAIYFVQDSNPLYGYSSDLIDPFSFYFNMGKLGDDGYKISANERNYTIAVPDAKNDCALLAVNTSYGTYSMKSYNLTEENRSMTESVYRQQNPFILREFENVGHIGTQNTINELKEYIASFTNNFNCYIIEETVQTINNTASYSPIVMTLSIPNKIKYNFGYFLPRIYNVFEFEQNDYELGKVLDMSMLLANTKVKSVNNIHTYSGNKVFSGNRDVKNNFFILDEKSVFSSNWDRGYYRNYNKTSEDEFSILNGYIPGIEDKSFFGSKCLVFTNDYIEISNFPEEISGNTYTRTDSKFNDNEKNMTQYSVTIDVTQSIIYMFQNNDVFKSNWSGLTYNTDISIQNYIKNVIMKIFNNQRKVDVTVYCRSDIDYPAPVMFEEPGSYENWNKTEDFKTVFSEKEHLMLTITYRQQENTRAVIHPVIKIYRY